MPVFRRGLTYGYSKDKRPDLKQCLLSTLCVDGAGSMWDTPEDGKALDKTRNTTLLSEVAPILAHHGVVLEAYLYIAHAALVTEANPRNFLPDHDRNMPGLGKLRQHRKGRSYRFREQRRNGRGTSRQTICRTSAYQRN